jgi:hypothetical protein
VTVHAGGEFFNSIDKLRQRAGVAIGELADATR